MANYKKVENSGKVKDAGGAEILRGHREQE